MRNQATNLGVTIIRLASQIQEITRKLFQSTYLQQVYPVSDTVTIDSTRHRWVRLEVSARLVATDSGSIKRLSMIFNFSFPRWQTAKFINTEYQ